jgi:small-conductance mechanosensitive channel
MMLDISKFISMFSSWAPLILEILLILLITIILNHLVFRTTLRLQEQKNLDRRRIRQIGLFSRYLIFLIGFIIILYVAGITPDLLLTGLGIAGIATGLAAQDLLSNLLSGIFLLFEKTINVSDVVRIGDVYGIVRLIKLRTTEIRTFDNNIVSIPNSMLSKSNVINMTSGSRYSMTAISVKLAYEADYDAVMEYMRDIVGRSEGVIIGALYGIKFEINNMEERYHGLKLTIYFFVEASNEPWIRTAIHKKIIEKLVEENVPFHRDSPK